MPTEWYPRECEFCTRAAALACEDPVCRASGYGEPHLAGCPNAHNSEPLVENCTCNTSRPGRDTGVIAG